MRAAACLTAIIVALAAPTGANQLSVYTEVSVNATCGENVTLTCAIDGDVIVVDYNWAHGAKTLCNYGKSTEERIHCHYTEHQRLDLSIRQVSLSDNGAYVCKVMAHSGHGKSSTLLHVVDPNQEPEPNQEPRALGSERTLVDVGLLVSLVTIVMMVPDFNANL